MNKRITALVLTFLMTIGLFTPVATLNAQASEMGGVARYSRPAELENATDVKALDEITDKEEERSFIFVTDESSKVAEKLNEAHEALNASEIAQKGNEYLMNAGFNDAISSALGNLNYNLEVKDKIKDLLGKQKGGLMETLSSIFNGSAREEYDDSDDREFNIVFSGFTMKMTTEEALMVRENIPEVKQIFVDYKYNRPDEKINMYNSSKMVNAPEAWDLGYKGEGRVVAVIDSGADITHPAMRLTNPDKARYDEETINNLISEHLLKGQYLNAKFPYGYNFMDHNMNLKDTNVDTGMHGMHVSGTVGANADEEEAKANSGLKIRGIAPEAQILVMRVFGQDVATTNTSAYIEAIEESIILGADSMNMSLGSMSGSEQGIDLGMDLALQNAKKAGSIVAIAGGNDFYTTWGNDNPRATNPDWGVMGTPGVAESAFTVANYNNNSMVTDASVIFIDNNDTKVEVVAKAMDTIADADFSNFESNKEYEIIDVGYGNKQSEYDDKNVSGNIVLASRGKDPADANDNSYSANFSAKIALAQKNGAAAFLLGNNEADKPDYFIIMQTQTKGLIPGYSVTYRNYKLIQKSIADAKAAGKIPMIKINTEKHEMANPGQYKMNESTSWGPNPSLRLKPEITAPGGEIYSTVNDGKYESMTGTSMATPHVAGGIALVNQFLQEKRFKIEGAEKHQFIKNLMMATATPILYENVNGFYNSPRVQGAGLMNLEAAVNPYLVTLTDASSKMSNGKAVVEFGSIKNEKLDFNLKLKNYSDKPATYKVHGIAQTDQVKDGKITFEPAKLGEEDFAEITVNANSEANFTGTINLTGKLEKAKQDQANGFFIDGFIFFESKANAEGAKEFADLSVPYLAFYGDWEKLPIIDVFADDIVFEETPSGKNWVNNIPFWYQGTDYNDFPGKYIDQWNFTHFYSKWHDGGRMIQGYQAWSDKYLGEFAISPNGDSDKDEMSFHGVFLRNADNLKFEFINEAGEVVKTIAEPYRSIIKKNYYDQKYTEDPVWTWRGEDKNGGQVPDGNYKVKITASAQDNKSSEQEYIKTVYVDRVKPEIELIEANQDSNSNSVTIKFKATDDRSGLAWMDVFELGAATEYSYEEVPGDEKSLIFNARFDNLDANFKLDDNMDKIWIGAMDMAGNYFERTLADIKNNGKVIFELKSSDPADTSFPKEEPILQIKVEENDGEKWYNVNGTNNLEYGDYRVFYPDLFASYIAEIDYEEFTLSGQNQEQKVTVTFTKVDDSKYGVFDLIITNGSDYPGDIKVFAVDKDGNYYVVPRKTNYAADMYETKLPAGEYTIVVEGNNPKEAPKLAFGDRTLVIKENETSEIETRLIWTGEFISYWFGADSVTFDEVFGNDISENTATDENGQPITDDNGNEIKYKVLKNFNKYFDVFETESGDKLNITEVEGYNLSSKSGYEEMRIEINVNVSGTYEVVSKFDMSKYGLENPILVLDTIYNQETFNKNVGEMYIFPQENKKGRLKVTTEFFTKKNVDKPSVKYELYNSRDELVEDWTNLPQGTYYLRTWVQDGFRPEREEYTIEVYEDTGLDQTLNVRWFHIGEESARKNPVVEFGIGGAETADYGEDIRLTLVNVEDGKTYEISVPIGKVYYELIPNGIYKMTVNLKDGWDYIFFTEKGNGGDRTQGNPDEVAFTESYNYIELALRRTNKPNYTTDYKLVINEEGLDSSASRPKYYLEDTKDKDHYYYTDKAEFINLALGEYTLYVDKEPTGYVAEPKMQKVTITDEDKVATAKVTYTIEDGRVLLSPLVKAIADAKKLLDTDNKLTDDYRKDLEALIKDGEDYLAKPDNEKTQDDIYTKAKAINDMLANPKHIVPPTPDPDPTPDPTPDPGHEPYEPSWPDEPYRPERPYRPYRPSVDKTEEKKEEPSIVTPKEEKKDYGIVDTEELLPVALNDIPNTAAGTAIRSLVSRGILAGMGNDKFQGELPITRAMVSAVLMRISVDKNINTQTKFTDVKAGDWFNEAVMWAAGNGLFVGYPDGSFKPNKLVSRQELAVILQKFLALHGINMDQVKEWTYNDLDKVPAWSKDAVVAMAKIALVNGQTDTMYNPESEFTREELAVMLYNIIRWVETH
ncbi:S8 family serine peptidase [uncultured Fenollaria sp.]|uniref:S8 family serine peptidase n=1 Tax=uncultured Fenollaria sp. TaxID=1686315 RepID=UPI0025DD4E65|nr:S8 family serine peptidase [uncultured Fenollaria sp.]